MTVLVDFSQVALGACMQFQNDLKTGSDDKIVSLIRHVVLSSLLSTKKKFSQKYGDLVVCCDGKDYWRKQVFPFYKASRSKNREKSDMNWKLIFDTLSSLREDLADNFPYKVIHVNTSEADDIIGVLVSYLQDNELTQVGLEEEPQKILILSSDQDNFQLHRFRNVSQWSPNQKKFVKPDGAHEALIEKICTGDTGDGIPNIMSDDDVFVDENKRQKPFKKARLEEFYRFGIDACKTDVERRNFQRNQALVSYEHIPQDLREKIITTYTTQEVKGSRQKIMQYLIKHRCKNLMDHIEEF
jgi:5'-3' exonuclease